MLYRVMCLLMIVGLLTICHVNNFAQTVDPRDSLTQLLNSNISLTTRVDVLNELAFNNFDVNDSLANLYARSAYKHASKIKYKKGEKYACTLIGLGYASAGKPTEAIAYFRMSAAIPANNANAIAAYNFMLWGTLYAEQGNYEMALHYYNKGRASAIGKSDYQLKYIYKNLARLHLKLWNNTTAIEYLDSASLINNNQDPYFIMELTGQYGIAYLNLLDLEKSAAEINKMCKLAEANTDYYHKIECKLFSSRLNVIKGDYHNALLSSMEAISFSNKSNNYQFVEVLIQIAETYLELSNLELSSQYLYQALSISKTAGYKHLIGIIYNNLAWITKIQRNYKEAINYTNMAQEILAQVGDKSGESEAINVRGLAYLLMEDYVKAESEFKKSLAIREEIKNVKGIAASMYNLADMYLEVERNKEALELLYKVIDLEKKIGNSSNLSMTYGLVARQLVREKRHTEALKFLKIAEQVAEEEQSAYIKRENARSYVFYYKALNDYKNAYKYQREYEYYTDEIYGNQRADKMAEYEALYKTKLREQEITLLNEKQKSQEERIQLQQTQLLQKNTILFLAVFVILLLTIIAWRNYRHNGKLILLNNAVINQREEALKANAAKTEFLANVSHELRTPLNGVIGFTDLLSKTPLNESQQKYVGIVSQSADTLLNLIDDILDFSKLDADKLQMMSDRVSLHNLINHVVNMIRFQAESKNLKLIVTIDSNVPEYVIADEIRLKQVLTNLLANAVKFTSHGEVELTVSMPQITTKQSTVRFSVRDTGIGIEPKNQKKIFDAFVQEDISTTKKFGGTGLGLTISNKILHLMGSKLELQSSPGLGSTFQFELVLPNTNA